MPRGKRNGEDLTDKKQKPYRPAAEAEAFIAKQIAKREGGADVDDDEHDGDEAEQAASGKGQNSGLTEDQQRVLFFQHLRKVRGQREKIATATADLRNMLKAAKVDGFSKKDIDFALALEDDEDGEMQERRRKEAQIAFWLGHPIGTQADLFEQPDRTPLVDKAREAGKVVGLRGDACSVPGQYAGHPTEQPWIDGWHEGRGHWQAVHDRTKADLDSPDGVLIRGIGEAKAPPPPLGPDAIASPLN